MKKIVIISSILVILLVFSITFVLTKPVIHINGDETLVLNYNDIYKEEGATIKKLFINIKQNVEISGEVNTSILGEYEVVYHFNDAKEVKRKIIVKDIEAPIIDLDNEITIFQYEKYNDNTVVATDNYDQEIEVKVIKNNVDTSLIDKFEAIYEACDSSNNCTQKTQIVNVIKPSILSGSFKQKTDYYPSILNLYGSTKTFDMTINLCEGMGTIEGSYEVVGEQLKLSFKPYQYYGFAGEENTHYEFRIMSDNSLKFVSSSVCCGPFKYDIYERN